MSVITFWNSGKEQTGKTMTAVAIASYMAITHNKKILLISTGYNDTKINKCFWNERKIQKSLGIFGPNTNTGVEEGIEGAMRVMQSNKLSPQIITNYTKIVYKERLEVLTSFKGSNLEYQKLKEGYPELINLANNYYDLVFVDLDAELGEDIINTIISNSNLIVASISQRLTSIDEFMKIREEKPILKSIKTIISVGRYDKFSKYTIKNISRYMKEKNKVLTIPYNTLFFEASEEARVTQLFLDLRSLAADDRNSFFIEEIKRASENIIYRLEDLKQRM